MDQLEASLKTINICSELQIKATYTADLNFERKAMLREGIRNTVDQLLLIVEELKTWFTLYKNSKAGN